MIKRILLLCCIALAAHAQRPLKWIADATQTAPVTFDCSRGETLTFTPVLKAYGITLTNYTASFQWQTNGMGTAFWSTNALVFGPSMDCGANRYRFFIRAESTGGVLYSAQGTINMLASPGYTVNALPLPVPQINFASVSWTNAPWLQAETDPGIPVAISTAVAQSGTNAQAMADAAQTNAIAFASTNKVFAIFNPANTSEYIDGAGRKYVISNFWEMTFSPDFASGYNLQPTQPSYIFSYPGQQYYERPGGSTGPYWSIQTTALHYFPGGFFTWDWAPTTNAMVLDPVYGGASGHAYVRVYSTTNQVGSFAIESSVVLATNGLASTAWVSGKTLTINGRTGSLGTNNTFTISAITNNQSSVSFSNLAANGFFSASSGRIYTAPFSAMPGDLGKLNFLEHTSDSKFKFFDLNYGSMAQLSFILAPSTESLEWGSGRSWFYPAEGASNTVASTAYVIAATNGLVTKVITNGLASTASLTNFNHSTLTGRDAANAHPISAITGLSQAIASAGGVPAVWSNMSWGASGTNSTYRMTWDATNGTFIVQEILP